MNIEFAEHACEEGDSSLPGLGVRRRENGEASSVQHAEGAVGSR